MANYTRKELEALIANGSVTRGNDGSFTVEQMEREVKESNINVQEVEEIVENKIKDKINQKKQKQKTAGDKVLQKLGISEEEFKDLFGIDISG